MISWAIFLRCFYISQTPTNWKFLTTRLYIIVWSKADCWYLRFMKKITVTEVQFPSNFGNPDGTPIPSGILPMIHRLQALRPVQQLPAYLCLREKPRCLPLRGMASHRVHSILWWGKQGSGAHLWDKSGKWCKLTVDDFFFLDNFDELSKDGYSFLLGFLNWHFSFGDLGKHRACCASVGSTFSTIYSLPSQGIPRST